jgi:hypothetical protein
MIDDGLTRCVRAGEEETDKEGEKVMLVDRDGPGTDGID